MHAGSPPSKTAAALADDFIARLSGWKGKYGPPGSAELERLLGAVAASAHPRSAAELIQLHETLLFLRAYPRNREVARLADRALFGMAARVAALAAAGADLAPLDDPEVSGIAGSGFSAIFSYEVAHRLVARHRGLDIDWEACDEEDGLGRLTRSFLPLIEEDWPVEAHPPFRRWIDAARPRGVTSLRWLLDRIARLNTDEHTRAGLYESARLPLHWELGDGRHTRSRIRIQGPTYFHDRPLLGRRDVSLGDALAGPPLPTERVSAREAGGILDVILDTSAMRYRELYGFTHPDARRVFRARAGRGLDIYFCGVPPAWRLPLRAYHAGMFFKNGVPAGYVEVLSLFDRAEVGFNLYYTFREGESAWIYARLLRLFRQVLGVNTFSVDPYQLGDRNEEALESGAFWFYRKLGFRPVDRQAARLVEREERLMAKRPGHRSPSRTLEKLAAGYALYDGPGAEAGRWDQFRVRNVGLAVSREAALHHGGDPARLARWSERRVSRALNRKVTGPLGTVLGLVADLARWAPAEKSALAAIVEAKHGPDESRYLRLMQKHARLRAAFLALGRDAPNGLRP